MPRKSANPKKHNTFADIAAKRTHYNPQVEGYGDPLQWRAAINERMGFEEAERVRTKAQAQGKWRGEFGTIGDMAGVGINESSMWSEIKSAFRKATMNCHPDRCATHGKTKEQAEEEFKTVTAAYVILEHKYGVN